MQEEEQRAAAAAPPPGLVWQRRAQVAADEALARRLQQVRQSREVAGVLLLENE